MQVIDIELSTNEDSVQNLAVAQSDGDSAVVFAGINSSSTDQKRGVNEHLRSFHLRYPKRQARSREAQSEPSTQTTSTSPAITPLSKAALFTPSTATANDTYQRVLRLAPVGSKLPRLGAIATGFAPEGEVIVFDATTSKPNRGSIRQRISLGKNKEADDVDVVATDDIGYLVTYCCNHEVFLSKLSADPNDPVKEPTSIYETPLPSPASSPRLKFRFVRFLTPKLIIGVLNLPKRSGTELFLLEVDVKSTTATVILRKTLQKRILAATTFAVRSLPSPTPTGNIQHVIAIGGGNASITILTLDHDPNEPRNLRFWQHSFNRDLHPFEITSLAFSTFIQPQDPAKASAQYLKLVSTSMGNTVVVQTLPLIPYPSPVAKREPSDAPVRYTLVPPTSIKGQTPFGLSALIAIILVAISAFLLQAVIEIRGATPEILGAKDWLSDSLREKIALPWMFDDHIVLTNSMPPLEPRVRKAYEVVKEGIETGGDDIKAASDEAGRQIKNAANQVKKSAKHQHHKIRDMLVQRAEHLATQLTSDDDDEEEDDVDDDDTPLFSNVYGTDHVEPEAGSQDSESFKSKTIVIKDVSSSHEHELDTELHHSQEDLARQGKVRKWEDLGSHEKRGWLRKLEDAGIWAAEEGETVLKGIFFGELAGAVAGAIQG